MFIYSTQPLLDPNLIHDGFYFTLSVYTAIWIFYFIDSIYFGLERLPGIIVAVITAIPLCIVTYVSFIHDFPVPMNEQVVATRVGFGSAMTSGRSSNSYPYVEYRLPDGSHVVFASGQGIAWHDQVILYKNIK